MELKCFVLFRWFHLCTDIEGGDDDIPWTSSLTDGSENPRGGDRAYPPGCRVLITLSFTGSCTDSWRYVIVLGFLSSEMGVDLCLEFQLPINLSISEIKPHSHYDSPQVTSCDPHPKDAASCTDFRVSSYSCQSVFLFPFSPHRLFKKSILNSITYLQSFLNHN